MTIICKKSNMMQEEFMTFYEIRKKHNSRLYISYNATTRNKYVFRYVSDISRIKFNNYLKFLFKIIYMTQDRSIPHSSR